MNQPKVACVQFKPVLGNVKRNLETISNFIEKPTFGKQSLKFFLMVVIIQFLIQNSVK